jgi:16S rRNA (guanine527-N7)-methyltransferase
MLTHHLLDSLAVVLPLRRALAEMATLPEGSGARTSFRLLDVGAGAGLPGVVIAITCPEVAVTCVDTVAKKAAFVQQVAASLTLPNLKGLHARVETLTEPYDVVCSRAFASLKDFTTWSRTALASHGIWLAMKGKHPDAELAELAKDVQVFHVEPLKVPGLDAERCIVWMRG